MPLRIMLSTNHGTPIMHHIVQRADPMIGDEGASSSVGGFSLAAIRTRVGALIAECC
jgi:hypothetical protein